jgi:hypothetical protein
MRTTVASGFPGLAEPWASVLIGLIAIAVIVWISVLVRVLRGVLRSPMDTGMKVVWVAFVMSSQPLGVLLWFLVGREYAYRRTA